MKTADWIKSTTGTWLPLETVNLTHVSTFGAYVIWHGGMSPRTVRVGQGDISDRLGRHRLDSEILAYRAYGTLYVTWAAVHPDWIDGIERHLADTLHPLVGDAFPSVLPIAVNSPWG